jgi:hypothetical protein
MLRIDSQCAIDSPPASALERMAGRGVHEGTGKGWIGSHPNMSVTGEVKNGPTW